MTVAKVLPLFPILFVSFFFLNTAAHAQGSANAAPASAQGPQVPARITQAIDNSRRVTLEGNVHPLARRQFDQGPLADAAPLQRMLLVLKRSDGQESTLRQLLDEQQNKSSVNYHRWLTPQQFGQQFGPADTDVQGITDWLASQGFTGIKVTAGRTAIEFSGTAGLVRAAFATEMHRFFVHGEAHISNATSPQIPAALAPVVAGVASLNDFRPRSYSQFLGTFRKEKSGGHVTPLFTFGSCGSTACFAVGPADFATIYNTHPLLSATPPVDGTGVAIAIVGASDINIKDMRDFRAMFGLPANDPNIIVNGIDPGTNGSEGESDLDVQWAGAVAPGAKVNFVTSADAETTAGIDLSALYIVDNNIAPVMSESFGACESQLGAAENQFINSLWQQAAAQGITVILSAGDGGGAGCDNFNTQPAATGGLAVSGFASTPFNVALGGTDFDQFGRESTFWKSSANNDPVTGESALSYIPEVPWNDSCGRFGLSGCSNPPPSSQNIIAGSGGASGIYGKPTWQAGPGVPTDNHRDLPDVSLFAGNGLHSSFYIICQSDANIGNKTNCDLNAGFFDFQGVGGTSAAAPAFAGIMALVNQKYGRQGNANYVLYALAQAQATAKLSCDSNASSLPAASCTFNDVTKGNNAVPCAGKSPNCSSAVTGTPGVLQTIVNGAATPAFTTTTGYDLATGLGSVNAQNLVKNWNSVRTTPTTTTLTLNDGAVVNVVHGASINVKVAVTPASASGDVGLVATGNFPNGTSRGFDRLTLSGGSAAGATTALPGGTAYQVTAHYEGDGTNAPSDSAPVPVTVTPEPSNVFITIPTFNSSGQVTSTQPASLEYGSPYIARVDVTNASGSLANLCSPPNCPTGAVTLTDNISPGSPNSGTFELNSSGFTENLPIQMPGGVQTLTAQYSGDNSFSPPSKLTTYNITVTPGLTATALAFVPSSVLVGTSFQIDANVTTRSSGVAPASDVALFDGSTPVNAAAVYNSVAGSATGPASLGVSFRVTVTSAGPHTFKVVFNGDGADKNYQSSTSGTQTASAQFQPASLALTPSASNINFGQSVTLTALLSAGVKSPVPTGTLTFRDSQGQIGSPVACAATTDSSGNAACTGSVSVTPQVSQDVAFVTYSGDANFVQSNSPTVVITVNIPDFSISPTSGSLTLTAGQTATAALTITPASNSSSTVALNCVSPFAAGATCTVNPASVNLSNSTAASATLQISTTAPSSSTTTQSVPVMRFGGMSAPRMSVPWRGAGLALGGLAGLAALLVLLLPRPKRYATAFGLSLLCVLGVSYGCGGGSSAGGGGGPAPTSLSMSASATKVATGQNVILLINLTSTRTAGGFVHFTDLTTKTDLGSTFILNGQGGAPVNVSLPLGTHAITASYSGDGNNAPSSLQTPLAITWTGSTQMLVTGATGSDVHGSSFTVTIN